MPAEGMTWRTASELVVPAILMGEYNASVLMSMMLLTSVKSFATAKQTVEVCRFDSSTQRMRNAANACATNMTANKGPVTTSIIVPLAFAPPPEG